MPDIARTFRGRRGGTWASFLLVLTLAGTAVGCGGSQKSGKVDYSVTAEQNYGKGLLALKREDWIAAAKYFSFIKARFPYSKFAVLAELRLNDAEFGAEHYLQAVDGYKMFIKFHPSHEMVTSGYAAFRIGECYVKLLPDDFWLLPPSYEKDQSATSDAFRELNDFMRKYPKSPQLDKAKKLLHDVNYRLAEHEMYVAKFYWKRGAAMGTVLRLRRLLDRHTGVGFDAEALFLIGKAYRKVGMPDRARKAWQELIQKFPRDERAAEARAQL